jgi:hypothetical protein
VIRKDSHNWANEEEVRKSWLKHIENEIGINFHAERGRNDASYNQVIIEFKDKGLFNGSTKSVGRVQRFVVTPFCELHPSAPPTPVVALSRNFAFRQK